MNQLFLQMPRNQGQYFGSYFHLTLKFIKASQPFTSTFYLLTKIVIVLDYPHQSNC